MISFQCAKFYLNSTKWSVNQDASISLDSALYFKIIIATNSDRLENVETHENAHSTLLRSYYTLSLQIWEHSARTIDEKSFSFYERPRTLNHLGTCLRSSCGCVLCRRGKNFLSPKARGKDGISRNQCDIRVHSSSPKDHLVLVRVERAREMRSQPILDLQRPERTNLIMRLCFTPPHCLFPSLLVRFSVSRESCKVARMPSTE